MKTCCFFGHRDTGIEIRPALYAEIVKHITQYGVGVFYVGGYGNFDDMSVDILRELKEKYPYIEIIGVLAYLPGKKEEYKTKLYDNTVFPEGLEFVPRKYAISHRNRLIIQQSDYLISCVRTEYGGAYEALRYAKRNKKQTINLAL